MVLHFGGEPSRINAYTLAATITGIADAAKAVNTSINPGYEIEIVVEALGAGSFRTTLRALLREGRNLFSADSARAVVLSVVATLIYERVLAPQQSIQVHVGPTEVVIEAHGDRVVVPRTIYDTARSLGTTPSVARGIGRAIGAVQADVEVTSFGVGTDPKSPPPMPLERKLFVALPAPSDDSGPNVRIIDEITEVQILRAILERSRRKWEFVWNGLRVSAPVLDDSFFDDFFAHRITIAPGDSLRVRMRLCQNRLPDLGIYITETYEIVEVLPCGPSRSPPPCSSAA